MSYYGVEPWQNQARQASWEHPPSRSGASSSTGGRDEQVFSFQSQLEEVERAIENLARSGKLTTSGGAGGVHSPYRRDPTMMPPPPPAPTSGMGRLGNSQPGDFGGPGHQIPPSPRHHSIGEYESRQGNHGQGHGSHNSSNVQGFYQNQRYGGAGSAATHGNHAAARKSEPDQMQQAQRRLAAQRERDLRNYHQEQQYNRGKPERTMSPNMSEEERRELIARQHRALYGDDQNAPVFDGRGPSPMSYPSFGNSPVNIDGGMQNNMNEMQQTGTSAHQINSNGTPPIGSQGGGNMNRTTTSSPKDQLPPQGASSPTRPHNKSMSVSQNGVPVAPIGTRPTAGSISQTSKRPTPPAASPLGVPGVDRTPSSASNPGKDSGSGNSSANNNSSSSSSTAWGGSSGVWGKNPLGVQASVWG